MRRALKILLVERSAPRSKLREFLLGNFDVNLTVHHAASEAELRQVARDFRPDVVLGSDQMPKNADLDWDILLLPSRRPPEVLLCEFHEGADPWQGGEQFQEFSRPQVANKPLPARHLGCVPDYFRGSDDVAVVLDAEGWVRHANATAERLMGAPASAHLHHANDLIDMLKAMAAGARPALPLVMLNLNGLPLLTRAYGRTVANAILKTLSDVVQPRYARCGILARLSQDEVLLVLSRGAAAPDAAVAVLGGKPLAQPYSLASWPGGRIAANHQVPLLTEEQAGKAPLRSRAKRDIRLTSRATLRSEVFDAQLGDAINRHALGVHYQPQFSLKDGRACGVEALARWTLNNGETLQPAAFIPLAERSGLIGALGATILKSACATAAAWRGEEANSLTLCVNVSQQQMDAKYARVLESVLHASGLAPARLELKVPERVLSTRASAFDCLRSWKSLGVRVAVNHDGNDYSALSYLSRVTVDRLKLNRHLVHRMPEDGRVAVLVRAVIALGAELGVEVMAEGVETEAQYALLQELGCTHAQGYLLARPMPAVQAHLTLRRPWGNLPRQQVRAGGALVN